jgi:hypothetical protein
MASSPRTWLVVPVLPISLARLQLRGISVGGLIRMGDSHRQPSLVHFSVKPVDRLLARRRDAFAWD